MTSSSDPSDGRNPIERLRDEHGKLPSHTWPGGYPLMYICRDGGVACPACANREVDVGQEVVAYDVHWEGPAICCDDCGAAIESAYGVPDSQ